MSGSAGAVVPESPCLDRDTYTPPFDIQEVSDIPGDTSVTCNDICAGVLTGTGEWTMVCDATANVTASSTVVGAQMVAIYDDHGVSSTICHAVGNLSVDKEYCSFGLDALGDPYYCAWDNDDMGAYSLVAINVVGGSEGDSMQLWWEDGSTGYDLREYGTTVHVDGKLFGAEGHDRLWGSRRVSSLYSDVVQAGSGNDRVGGLAGDDFLNGQLGDDVVCGDDDDDTLTGGGDSDTLCGLAGAYDSLDGGTGPDFLSHGGQLHDYDDGGPGTDTCDVSGTSNCEYDWGATDPCDSL